MPSVHLTIDDQEITAEAGQTILDAAQAAGIDIPVLCNHPALEPVSACRVCLVEIEKQAALQPACSFKVSEGMVVRTESEKVVETRKFVLELLFAERNHFCMYCQMSGDCELQDLGYRYGLDSWMYPRPYPKLPVDATRQYFVMDHNRCVLCRRCIRACADLVGNHTLGLGGRGVQTMVIADTGVPFGESSCISCGTCLQTCPTGAIMDRLSAYRGLETQVERTKSVCAACSVGCGVELITRDNQLLRVEGDWDAEVNGGLLCVAGRFEPLWDNRQRVSAPMVRRNGDLEEETWESALDLVAEKLKGIEGTSLAALASPRTTSETLDLFAELFGRLNAKSIGSLQAIPEFLVNEEGSLAALDEANLYLVVGEDLSIDHQVVGMAVRRGVMNRGARLVIIGEGGNGMADYAQYSFKPTEVDKAIALAKKAGMPVVIYGASAGGLVSTLRHELSGRAQFVGLVPGSNGRGALAAGLNGVSRLDGLKGAYVLAADDEIDGALLSELDGSEFVVAQTSYQGPLVERADVVLPTAIWAEKSGTFVNTEGRTQALQAVLKPPARVKTDQEILQALAERIG